jgi:hypothetical protein
MSAFGGKADIAPALQKCPLMTQSGLQDPLAETFQREIIHTWHRIGGYDTLARRSLKYLVFEFVIGAVSSYQSAATVTFEPGSGVLGSSTST